MKPRKIFIYQLLPRLLGNTQANNIQNGTLEENGCGKFNDITGKFLNQLKKGGYSHVWLIGVLAHASTRITPNTAFPVNIRKSLKAMPGLRTPCGTFTMLILIWR